MKQQRSKPAAAAPAPQISASGLGGLRPSARLRQMSGGSVVLSLFGGLWMVVALNAASWPWLVACVLVPTSLLLLRSLALFHTSHEAAGLEPAPTPAAAAAARMLSRRFSLIFITEVATVLAAVNLLAAYGGAAWMVAAVAFIVAGFFLPLARALRYPVYYWTGGIELALCTAAAVATRTRIAAADPLFGLAIGLTLWATVIVTLTQGGRWGVLIKNQAKT